MLNEATRVLEGEYLAIVDKNTLNVLVLFICSVSFAGDSQNKTFSGQSIKGNCPALLISLVHPVSDALLNGYGIVNLSEFLEIFPYLPMHLEHPRFGRRISNIRLISIKTLGNTISFVGDGPNNILIMNTQSKSGYLFEHVAAQRLDRKEGSSDVFQLAKSVVTGSYVEIELIDGSKLAGIPTKVDIKSKDKTSFMDLAMADNPLEEPKLFDTSLMFVLRDGSGKGHVIRDESLKRIVKMTPLDRVDPESFRREFAALWSKSHKIPLEALVDKNYLWRFDASIRSVENRDLSALGTWQIEAIFRNPKDKGDFLLKFSGVDDFISLKDLNDLANRGFIKEVKTQNAWMMDYLDSNHFLPKWQIPQNRKPDFIRYLTKQVQDKTPHDWDLGAIIKNPFVKGPFVVEKLLITHFTKEGVNNTENTYLGVVIRSLSTGETFNMKDHEIFDFYNDKPDK